MRKTRVWKGKRLIIFLMCFGAVTGGHTQELAEEEIRGVTSGDISFSNYEGPYEKIESAEEIRSIGENLSSEIKASEETETSEEQRAGYFDKYSIIRIDPLEGVEKYGADIFRINQGARVDHIENVRRMISGYVQNVFDYTREEADTIAVFLTFYNAVHRGDMDYFEDTYHEGVTEAVDPEKAGIATRYSEWPGNTELLIPLRTVGEDTALSNDTVGEEDVIDKIREEEEDRGVEDRKEMVEIRERELEEEEEETEKAREEVEQREQELEEKEEEAAEAERELESTQEEEAEEEEEAEAEESPETADEEIDREREEIEEEKEEIEKEEEEQEERRESIQEERERIAEDQQEVIEEEEEEEEEDSEEEEQEETEEAPQTVPFILFEERDGVFGRLVEVDRNTGKIHRSADINTIRSKNMVDGQDGLILVAGKDDPPRAVRLVEIDSESLEIERQSEEDIYPGSALVKREGNIYALTKDEDRWYIGRFSEDLELAARSTEEVAPQTMLLFEEGYLFVQKGAGEIILLDPGTLKRIQN
ncbi:MAG: P83/100 family protein [Spirochaetia bacterium]